jgi:hypothetical protein
MGSKPKAPKPTAQELELQRRQRGELDTLTRDRNSVLKAIKRALGGRRSLLGSGSERGVAGGGRTGGAGGRAGSGGGILSSGSGGARSAGGSGFVRTPQTPGRGNAR